MRAEKFLLILAFCFLTVPCGASSECRSIFTAVQLVKGEKISFTQAAIGKRWAEYKKSEYLQEYETAFKKDSNLTLQSFIQNKTAEKPIRSIIDINGVVRIIDNHHKLYALTLLYGREIDFQISVLIVKDYSMGLVDGAGIPLWTPEKMLFDMANREFIKVTTNAESLSLLWFNTLPKSLYEMGDSPMRSLISFVMESFPVKLKGSDFEPHVQNHLGQKMLDLGIELFSKDSFSKDNIDRLREVILQHPDLVTFLLERALKNTDKFPKIEEMLTEKVG